MFGARKFSGPWEMGSLFDLLSGPDALAGEASPAAGARVWSPATGRKRRGVELPDAAVAWTAPLDPVINQHRAAVEGLLAAARLVAAVVLLVVAASEADSLRPAAARLLMAGYVVHAMVVLAVVRTRPEVAPRRANVFHLLDLAWATTATTASGGTSSNIFPLFAFVLVASGYRWGLRHTLLDGAFVVVIASAQSVPAVAGLTPWPFHLDLYVLRVSYIVMLAVLFGVLSERQHALGFQAVTLARLAGRLGRATGLGSAIHDLLGETARLFDARQALLVVEESDTRRLFLWRAERQPAGPFAVSWVQLRDRDHHLWLGQLPPDVSTFEVRRADDARRLSSHLALDLQGRVIEARLALPAALLDPEEWQSLIGARVDSIGSWRGQLYLLDPSRRPGGELRLGFLQSLAGQAGPVLLNLYLLRQVRSRAESRERARIARDLHDGAIQGLAALEMRLEVLGRQTDGSAPATTAELRRVRNLLHVEQVNLRDLMQQLRPIDVDARRLPCELGDLAERFSRSGAMDVRLDWAVDTLDIAPSQCREVVRIVQEALVNARRHGSATRVDVRVESDATDWALIVEDNGRGLDFTGRKTHAELEAQQKGPRVIRERVAALHGALAVESSSSGARLEMTFPHARHG